MELGGDPEQTTLTADRDTTKSTGARNFAGNDPREVRYYVERSQISLFFSRFKNADFRYTCVFFLITRQ